MLEMHDRPSAAAGKSFSRRAAKQRQATDECRGSDGVTSSRRQSSAVRRSCEPGSEASGSPMQIVKHGRVGCYGSTIGGSGVAEVVKTCAIRVCCLSWRCVAPLGARRRKGRKAIETASLCRH